MGLFRSTKRFGSRLSVASAGLAGGAMQPMPAAADGAIAIALPPDVVKQGFAYGFATDYADVNHADAEALSKCRETTIAGVRPLCTVVKDFKDQCVAVAMDPQAGTPGVGWARRRRSARRRSASAGRMRADCRTGPPCGLRGRPLGLRRQREVNIKGRTNVFMSIIAGADCSPARSRRRCVLAAAAAPATSLAAGALAVALPPDVAKGGFSYGYANDKADDETAAARALELCRTTKDASNDPKLRSLCKVIMNYSDKCVAVADGPGGRNARHRLGGRPRQTLGRT